MLELINVNEAIINTKDRVTIELIKDGEEFLEKFDVNRDLLIDSVSLIYRFLRKAKKIPHNLYKFFVSAYFIVSRHPLAFPAHESKKQFCKKFGLQQSSLNYCVDKLTSTLEILKFLDDRNYPYFLNCKNDLGIKLIKSIIKSKVEKYMMKFLLYNQPINSQILSEELVNKIIFEMKLFPEELFRQFYEIVFEMVEFELQGYNEYIAMQQKFFV